MAMARSLPLVLLLACALPVLGGCGGGSGTTSTGPGGGLPPGTPMSAPELQSAMDALTAINAHRAAKMLPPLTWYAAGAQVAYDHCLAMEAGGFFDHTNPNTMSTPSSRAQAAGIVHDPMGFIDPVTMDPFVGENLANAQGVPMVVYTGADAVNAWVGSPGHHTQIDAPLPVAGAQTMPAWTHCGIGVRMTTTQVWYTAMFFRNPN